MKKRMARILITSLCVSALSGCVMNKLTDERRTITLEKPGASRPIRIEIIPGDEWSSRMQAGPFVFNVLPQFVIWAEDEAGAYLETIYVTGADFQKVRHASKHADGAAFFAQMLPVWAKRVQGSGESLPSKEQPYPDSVTSATPMAETTIDTSLSSATGPVVLYFEINQSGDVNDAFTKESNGDAGQPSLIYRARVEPGTAGAVEFELLGHGGTVGPDGPVGRIHENLTGFDSALSQVQRVTVAL